MTLSRGMTRTTTTPIAWPDPDLNAGQRTWAMLRPRCHRVAYAEAITATTAAEILANDGPTA